MLAAGSTKAAGNLDGDRHKISVRIGGYLWEKGERKVALEGSCSGDGRAAEKQDDGVSRNAGGWIYGEGVPLERADSGAVDIDVRACARQPFEIGMRGRDEV